MEAEDICAMAQRYRKLGLAVFPIKTDGSKAPMNNWKAFQKVLPHPELIAQWFSEHKAGMGMITGSVSGDVFCLDFDSLDAYTAFEDGLKEAGHLDLLERLVMVETPRPGRHLLGRCCSGVGPNQVLARRKLPDGTFKTTIETRGEGGYILLPGSPPECHPAKKAYIFVQKSMEYLDEFTAEEYAAFLQHAKALDEGVPAQSDGAMVTHSEDSSNGPRSGRFRPGDDFNQRGTWDFLYADGWTEVSTNGDGNVYLRRPGKDEGGSSATLFAESDSLYVHSTNASPFHPGCSYSKFAAYSLVKHGGSFTRASVDLAKKGYGLRGLNDVGNAVRFAEQCAAKALYVPTWRKWIIWDGNRWKVDDSERVLTLAKEVVQSILSEVELTEDEDQRKSIRAWHQRSCTGQRIREMVRLSQDSLAVQEDELDCDAYLLNVLNGTIDLRTGTLQQADPANMITKTCAVAYRPKAPARRFHRFVEEVFPDEKDRTFVQRALGYGITASQKEQKLFLMVGSGANGKGTLIRAIAATLHDYYQESAPSLLLKIPGKSGANSETARLAKVRLVAISEQDGKADIDEAQLKRLTGNDRLTARHLYGNYQEFSPTHTLFVATNKLPTIIDNGNAIWRRIAVIPFTQSFMDRPEKDLDELLYAEREGILAWLVEGCLEWQRRGLDEPASVKRATQSYKADMDSMDRCLQESCNFSDEFTTGAKSLKDFYHSWCQENGEPQHQRISDKDFFRRLVDDYGCKRRHTKKGNEYVGIGLKDADDSDVHWLDDFKKSPPPPAPPPQEDL